MENVILENKLFKLVKTADNKYEILDKKDNSMVVALEGNYTKEQLQEQLDNCHENYVFI